MCNQNVLPLSLSGDTFNALKSDFDSILRNTISNMELKGADTAEMNIKLKISLAKEQTRDFDAAYDGAMRDIIKPKFEHAVQSVLQIKDKKDGTLSGNYELVWDKEAQKYVMREITDGQTTLFDKEAPSTGAPAVIDADYKVVGDEQPALQGRKVFQLSDPAADESDTTPFDWMRQFIGATMKVMEAMGNYTVRTEDNKVVLSSVVSQDSPFYCPAEKLEKHLGHELICIGSPSDEPCPEEISVWCDVCDEVLFSIENGSTGEDVGEPADAAIIEDGGGDEAPAEDGSDGAEEEGVYEYNPPEAEEDA